MDTAVLPFCSPFLRRIVATLLVGIFLSSAVAAQDLLISGVAISEDDTAAQIESAIAAVEARKGLNDDVRRRVLEYLRDAEAQLQNRINATRVANNFAATLDTAPAETRRLRALLDEELPAPETIQSLGIDAEASLAELQQALAKATTELSAKELELAELTAQVEVEVGRPANLRVRIAQLQRDMEQLAARVDDQVESDEPQILRDARKLALQFTRAARRAEINKFEQELLSHDVRLDELRAKRDAAARAQVLLQQRASLLRDASDQKEEAAENESRRAAIEAQEDAADKDPVIRTLVEENAALALSLANGAKDIREAREQLVEIRSATNSIEQRLSRSRQHIDVGGLSRVTGRLLIEERRNLPQISRYRSRSSEIAEVGIALLFITEQRRELTPLDDKVQDFIEQLDGADKSESEIASITDEVRQLLRSRRELLLQAENSYRGYLQVLGDLELAQRQLVEVAGDYKELLDRNLLWIPSAPLAFDGSWADIVAGAKWAVSPASWSKSLAVLVESLREHIGTAAAFMLLLGLTILTRQPLAAASQNMNQRIGRLSADHIGLTIAAVLISAVRAAPVPLLLAGVSWFLQNSGNPTSFSTTMSQALSVTATFLFNVLWLRMLAGRSGVFEDHFDWAATKVALVRRQLGKLAIVGAPLIFFTVLLFVSDNAPDNTNLGRYLFVPLMCFVAFIIHPLMHPGTGLVGSYYQDHPDVWRSKLRWTWYSVAVGVPLLLGLISILGNVYASTKLFSLFVNSVWFMLGLLIINMIVLRWLALSRRKLELKLLLQKRESLRAEKESGIEASADAEGFVAPVESLDLDAVDLQSRKLLRASLVLVAAIGLWRIWAEVLPAFMLLEGFSVWSRTDVIDGVETINPVTLADLLLALLVILSSVIASRNLAGFMEIAIPQRLKVEPGSRYAINTLVRYFIIMAGVVVVLNIIGWNWSQIQWLVAALSVGLGFGLQEIVANFVSGLVILFERPVRVGDTVTVGQLTGTVSRIRIRATTITDWDRKEIIVPNKSFITEQVVNWTLTDPITRIVIPVSVSYGSDATLAHKVMEDTLAAIPLVLEEPAPKVYFSGFGESSLDFKLYVYLRQLTDRMILVHEVHNAIFKALKDNDIEIPFPQRDLHIRSAVEPQAKK